jgi:hypothetical protein
VTTLCGHHSAAKQRCVPKTSDTLLGDMVSSRRARQVEMSVPILERNDCTWTTSAWPARKEFPASSPRASPAALCDGR